MRLRRPPLSWREKKGKTPQDRTRTKTHTQDHDTKIYIKVKISGIKLNTKVKTPAEIKVIKTAPDAAPIAT